MEIRSPHSAAEVTALAKVAAAAFNPGEPGDHWIERYAFLEQMFGREIFLGVAVDDRFVSSCICVPAPVWAGKQRLMLGAIGGVATLPDQRQHGYAGAMMRAAVRGMRERGLSVSALWPFSFPYYRKFGWDFACEDRVYRFAPDQIGPLPAPEGVAPLTEADLPGMMAVSTARAQALAFCTDRYEAWWRDLLRKSGVPPFAGEDATGKGLVCRDGDAVAGYAIYQENVEGETRRAEVRELTALTGAARLRLLAGMAAAGATEITFRAPANDRFRSQVPDPRRVAVTLEPGFSFRVVEPVAALGALPVPEGLRGEIGFLLHDPACPETPLRVTVETDGEQIQARAGKSASSLHLEMDIPLFSQLFSGALRPWAARWIGRLAGDTESLAFAERLLPRWIAFRSGMEPG